jgi:hypothetical protein
MWNTTALNPRAGHIFHITNPSLRLMDLSGGLEPSSPPATLGSGDVLDDIKVDEGHFPEPPALWLAALLALLLLLFAIRDTRRLSREAQKTT